MISLTKYYYCKCINPSGQRVTLSVETDNLNKLNQHLNANNLALFSSKIRYKIKYTYSSHNHTRFTLIFTQQISTLLQTGISLQQSIEFLINTESDKISKRLLQDILFQISNGSRLSDALTSHKKYFGAHYCALIHAAEEIGTLDRTFSQLYIELEHFSQIKSKIKKTLLYPVSLLIITLLVTYVLIGYILPKFNTLFATFDKQLPPFTLFFMSISNSFKSLIPFSLLLLLVPTIVAAILFKKNQNFRRKSQQFLNHTPIIGSLISLSLTTSTLRILATTLDANIPLIKAFSICQKSSNNIPHILRIQTAIKLINAGESLHNALQTCHLFNKQTTQIIAAAEHSNHLAKTFLTLTRQTQQEFDRLIDRIQKLIEPFIILVLSSIIGCVIIAIYLPIFDMGNIM